MALRRAIPHITLQQDAYICINLLSKSSRFDHNGEEPTTMVSLTREIPERHQGGSKVASMPQHE